MCRHVVHVVHDIIFFSLATLAMSTMSTVIHDTLACRVVLSTCIHRGVDMSTCRQCRHRCLQCRHVYITCIHNVALARYARSRRAYMSTYNVYTSTEHTEHNGRLRTGTNGRRPTQPRDSDHVSVKEYQKRREARAQRAPTARLRR